MSVFNRRNAVLGWATWSVGKRMLHRKAEEEAKAAAEAASAKRWWSRGAAGDPPPEPEPKKRSKRRLVPFVMAALVGLGLWFRGRRKSGEVDTWTATAPPATPPPPFSPPATAPPPPPAERDSETSETEAEAAPDEPVEGDEPVE